MTNAAAFALHFFINPNLPVPALHSFRMGPLRNSAHRVYEAFFSSLDTPKVLEDARFCENRLRELGRSEDADRIAAIGRLLSFGVVRDILNQLREERLRVIGDVEGTPTFLARVHQPRFGLPIPLNEHTGRPDLGLALDEVEKTQDIFLREGLPVCPLCFRLDHEHDDSCPMHVPLVVGMDKEEPPSVHIEPCPFCRASGRTIRLPHEDLDDTSDAGAFVVRCGRCGMHGPAPRPGRSALEAWNQRDKEASG